MPRSRNIKHAFFTNDDLAELNSPLGRLLFIGLWTISDFKGDIEYKPKKIKALILPYDDCDIEEIVINLDKSGFINFYSCHGVTYLHIANFGKHQNPHPNEKKKGSIIPAFSGKDSQPIDSKGLAINPDLIRSANDKKTSNPADSLFLIPYSCIPDPDPLIPDPVSQDQKPSVPPEGRMGEIQEIFEFWKVTLNHPRSNLDDKRKALIRKHLKAGYSVKDLKSAVQGCANTAHNMGDNDRGQRYDSIELILRDSGQVDRFMGNDALQPVSRSDANKVTLANIAAGQEFLRGKK